MKLLFKQFLHITILCIGTFLANGADLPSSVQSFFLQMAKTPSNEKGKENESGKGQRIPTQPIECYISSDGIQFTSVAESPDILAYELWDAEGTCCIASFFDEAGFINFLFSQSGEFQIRFTTPEYNLVGFIQI